jgi:hypothetical protein
VAAGDVKYAAYPASSNLTATGLNSLASSSTWLAGYELDFIDNSTNKYTDFRVTAKVVVGASPTANPGEIRLYAFGMLDDSTWPDVFDGTPSAETVRDTEVRDAVCRLAAFTLTDTTASRTYYVECPSLAEVFRYALPEKIGLFVTHNTGQAFASSGHQVTVKGSYLNVAA